MKRLLLAAIAAAGIAAAATVRADAMPPFAQAYSANCDLCHTQVPALNSYGRYVQRTGYASLDPHVLHRSVPLWIGENTYYDTQDPAEPHKTQFGNLALHMAGIIDDQGNWSYHLHQWITQNDASGGVDTFWVSYNNLLHRDGHLMVGKIESPGPSVYSQWMDMSGFASAEYSVGEHVWENDANRWGAKLNYEKDAWMLEAGYLATGADFGTATDFSNDTDKTFQWKAAWDDVSQPYEIGLYGNRGSTPLAEGPMDNYTSLVPYVERDPVAHLPGFLVMYQMGRDSNPDDTFNAVGSNAATAEIYESIFNGQAMISLRKEWVNDGLGNRMQSGNVDFGYHLARFLHFYAEAGMQQNNTPAWRYMIWWTLPVSSVK